MTLFTALRAVFEHSQRQRKPCQLPSQFAEGNLGLGMQIVRSQLEHSQSFGFWSLLRGSSTDFLDYVKAHFEDVCDDVVESTILDQNNQARRGSRPLLESTSI